MRSFSHWCSSPIVVAFVITSITPLAVRAQSTTLPPARTYHVDQYGQQTKVVKERWSDNANGEKQGVYLLYNVKGLPITKYTYTNGVKNGPAYLVGEDYFYSISFRMTVKSIGNFLNGKEQGVWEVYAVNLNGETGALDRRATYERGELTTVTTYREGKPYATYKYADDKKNGPVKVYDASSPQYATGQYVNNVPVGIWRDAGVQVEKGNSLTGGAFLNTIYRKGGSLTYAQGKLATSTEPNGKSRTAEEVLQQYVASQRSAVPLPATTASYYTLAPGEQAKFDRFTFNVPGGSETIVGAQLRSAEALKTATLAQYLEANTDPDATRLLLKTAKQLGANPTQLIATNPALTWKQLYPFITIESAQLDGELLYYALRGTEAEKGHGTNLIIQRLIKARSTETDAYKRELEANFYRCAKGANDAYSDPVKYPLRRWLYEEYKDQDAFQWMNRLTKSDPQNDQINFPKLYGN
jgi:antitoxin component YwqK of YwqJK toxin-antitoxin module